MKLAWVTSTGQASNAVAGAGSPPPSSSIEAEWTSAASSICEDKACWSWAHIKNESKYLPMVVLSVRYYLTRYIVFKTISKRNRRDGFMVFSALFVTPRPYWVAAAREKPAPFPDLCCMRFEFCHCNMNSSLLDWLVWLNWSNFCGLCRHIATYIWREIFCFCLLVSLYGLNHILWRKIWPLQVLYYFAIRIGSWGYILTWFIVDKLCTIDYKWQLSFYFVQTVMTNVWHFV